MFSASKKPVVTIYERNVSGSPFPIRVKANGSAEFREVCYAAHQRKKLGSQGQGSALLGAPRTQPCAATLPASPLPTNGLRSKKTKPAPTTDHEAIH